MADVTEMRCFHDFAGKEVRLSAPMFLVERRKGALPDLRQLMDGESAIPPLLSRNAAWLKFTRIPKGTPVHVERVLYSEEVSENTRTGQKEKANRMTAVVCLSHPETRQVVRSYYHMGARQGAVSSPSGVTIWTRFKELPWPAAVSGLPFFAPAALDARRTQAAMRQIPFLLDGPEGCYKLLPNPRGFDGYGAVRHQFVELLKNDADATLHLHAAGGDRRLHLRRERRQEFISFLENIKMFEDETIESGPTDGFGHTHPLPQGLQELCSIWINSSMGQCSLSFFTMKDIMHFFTID